MCGIAGIIEKNKNNKELMERMLELIKHRGPDNSSVYVHRDITLGHRRLSIIDLVTGNQPIFNEDKSICIIYNGEIYNYKELRSELAGRGHTFNTNSDTEVIVHGYEEHGINFFARLKGIFAFAVYELEKNRVILARDHFGIKPLHYYHKDELFIFGSEQKSILLHNRVERNLNYKSLHLQLNLRYTQGEETLFKGIKRLPPAHYLVYENNQVKLERFWRLDPQLDNNMTEEDACEKINFFIKQAVHRQLISDVPIGVYLSGGMDSSVIVQKMHELNAGEINTFTLGFNEPTDEFPDSKIIAEMFHTKHRTLTLPIEPLKNLPEVIWHAEEPKINLLQGFNMSKFVAPHVKVVLGGLGGDELFAGYDIHKFIYPFNRINQLIPKGLRKLLEWKSNFIFKLQNASKTLGIDEYRRGIQMLLAIGDIERFYLTIRNVWDYNEDFYGEIYNPEFLKNKKNKLGKTKKEFEGLFDINNSLTSLDKVLFAEFHSKMVNDYLLVEDRMSMSHSVEERVPYLDIDLVNFAFSIPINLKMKHNKTKYLFRAAMKGKLPDKILQKKKWGFTVNPYMQFRKDLKNVAEKVLTKNFIAEQGIFNYDYLNRIINHTPNPRLRWHYNYLWVVLGFAVLEKMFIRSNNFAERKFELEDYFN